MKMLNRLLICVLILNVANSELYSANIFRKNIADFLKLNNKDTSACLRDLNTYVSDLELNKKWAVHMSNAASQMPSGFYQGNLADLGAFDQCINIEEDVLVNEEYKTISGKYCLVEAPLQNILKTNLDESDFSLIFNYSSPQESRYVLSNPKLKFSICVPNSCEEEELTDIVQQLPDFRNYEFTVKDCQTKNKNTEFQRKEWIFLIFLVIIMIIMASSTVYDIHINNANKKPWHEILLAFSVYTNGQSLFSMKPETGNLSCINGIRFFSTLWIIFCHTALVNVFGTIFNNNTFLQDLSTVKGITMNGAAFAVDTFFFIGGLLLAYNFMKTQNKGNKFNLWKYYAHRYLRLTPALAVVMLFHITLARYMASGPNWPRILNSVEGSCTRYWWSVLLYLQNYVNPEDMCIEQSWYLSADMQLYLISPLLLLTLVKSPKLGITCLTLCCFFSQIVSFVVTYVFKFHGIPGIAALKTPNYLLLSYYNIPVRFGPWIIGIFMGYIIHKRNEFTNLNSVLKDKRIIAIGWIVTISIILIVIYAPITFSQEYDRLQHSAYVALHRTGWCVALSWIIYISILGEGGLVNKLLSHPLFQMLSRLSYCMYIIHGTLLFIKVGGQRQPKFFTDYEFIHDFFGNVALAVIISIFWTLAFEMPFTNIDKIILGKGYFSNNKNK